MSLEERLYRAWRCFDYWNSWGFPLMFCIRSWFHTLFEKERKNNKCPK